MNRGVVSLFAIGLVFGSLSIAPGSEAPADDVRPLAVGDVLTVLVRYDQREPMSDDAEALDAAVFRIAAVVTSVRPNGNLVLAAKRGIRDGQTTWLSSLSGVVRPDVVDPVTRTVNSNEVADLHVVMHTVGVDNYETGGQTQSSAAAVVHQPLKQYVVRVSLEEAGAVMDGKQMPAKVLTEPSIAVCENRTANFNIGGQTQVGNNQTVPCGASLKLKVASIDDEHARVSGVLEFSAANQFTDDIAVRESMAIHFKKTVKLGEKTIRQCVSKSENCLRYFQMTVDDVRIDAQAGGAAQP